MDDSTALLREKHCVPCEGGVAPLMPEQTELLLRNVRGWRLVDDGKGIRKEWRMQDFAAGIEFFDEIGKLADEEDHHPDLHLVGYRNVSVELSTHAIGGLSENDFILASKIDELPVRLKE